MKAINDKLFNVAGFSFFIYALASAAMPICLLNIKEDLNFSFTQAGLFGLICSIEQTIVLFMSPLFASKFGKIRVLKVAMLLLGLGLVCFSISINFFTALLSALCMGLGVANMEALLTPLVNDLYPEDKGSKMNKLHAFWPLGSLTALIAFGFLLSRNVHWRYLYIFMAVIALLVFVLYPSSKKVTLPASAGNIFAVTKILKLPGFWLFALALFFEGGAEGAFAFWAATLVQIHLKGSAFYAGMISASFAFGMMLGRFTSSKILMRFSTPKTLIVSALLAFVISLSFYFVNSLIGLAVFLFAMGATLACLWPTIQSYAAFVLPVDTTILMTFLSCFGVPGYSTSSFIMGIIADKYNLFMAFILVVPFFVALIPVFFILACKLYHK